MTFKGEREVRKKLKASGLPFALVDTSRHLEVVLDGVVVLHLSRGAGRDYGRLDTLIRQRLAGKTLKNEAVRQNHEASRLINLASERP